MKPHTVGYLIFMMDFLKSVEAFNVWATREGYSQTEVINIYQIAEAGKSSYKHMNYASMI